MLTIIIHYTDKTESRHSFRTSTAALHWARIMCVLDWVESTDIMCQGEIIASYK